MSSLLVGGLKKCGEIEIEEFIDMDTARLDFGKNKVMTQTFATFSLSRC